MKKIILMLLVFVLSFSFVGCGETNEKRDTDREEIEALIFVRGNGREWIDNIAKAWEEKQDKYYVNVRTSSAVQLSDSLPMGPADNTIDLYMGTDPNYLRYVKNKNTDFLEKLNDVVNYVNPGETKSIKDKMTGRLYSALEVDGDVYTLPHSVGATGLAYNAKKFEEKGYKIPRTTKELIELSEQITKDGMKAFICSASGYWKYAYAVWWMQYDGEEEYYKFFDTTDSKGEYPSPESFRSDMGLVQALRVLDDLLDVDNVIEGSNSKSALVSEVYLQTPRRPKDPYGLMMPNIYCLRNEVDNIGDIRMMKVPMIHTLADVLWSDNLEINNDGGVKNMYDTLSACVAKIDGDELTQKEQELVSKVSASDMKRLTDARNMMSHAFLNPCGVYVPKYASAKEGAKEFLKFFYSDEGLRIYYESTKEKLPFIFDNPEMGKIDQSKWTEWDKSVAKVQNENTIYVWEKRTNPVFYVTGLNVFDFHPEVKFTSVNVADRQSADEYILWNYNYTVERWTTIKGQVAQFGK